MTKFLVGLLIFGLLIVFVLWAKSRPSGYICPKCGDNNGTWTHYQRTLEKRTWTFECKRCKHKWVDEIYY